ncbi:MAG: YciI family protein [Leptospirales bacterium]|jgi:hypothetical protein
MKDFVLLLRDHGLEARKTPELHADLIQRFGEWTASLRSSGAYQAAAQLADDAGCTARRSNGELILDGPFSEAKEVIVGFYHIRARDLADAGKIATECPLVEFGGSVEVREILSSGECQ